MFMGKIKKLSLLMLVSTIPLAAFANNTPNNYTIVAPVCLLKNMTAQHSILSNKNEFSLFTTNREGMDQLIAAKANHKKLCGGFINVTDAWDSYTKQNGNASAFLQQYSQPVTLPKAANTYSINHEKEAAQLISQLNPDEMWGYLSTLSSSQDRYANSDSGVKTATWFKENIEKIAAQSGRKDVSVQLIKTGNAYKQPSVVVKVGNSTEPAVVVGGHMDTLQGWFGNMPGADDDGSGSVTVLEVAKTILASNMQFKRPIYFIWYSAEEEGLIGSQYVVAEFKKNKIPVAEVLHMDMTGFENKNDPTLWLIKDYTNPELTAFLETLINTYVKQPVKYTQCGYACSDHATWTQNGFKSAIAFESEFGKDNPKIHTAEDTMSMLSLTHMMDYAKLATAFTVELAEPVV
jgi:leucyl aminopeptidase